MGYALTRIVCGVPSTASLFANPAPANIFSNSANVNASAEGVEASIVCEKQAGVSGETRSSFATNSA